MGERRITQSALPTFLAVRSRKAVFFCALMLCVDVVSEKKEEHNVFLKYMNLNYGIFILWDNTALYSLRHINADGKGN